MGQNTGFALLIFGSKHQPLSVKTLVQSHGLLTPPPAHAPDMERHHSFLPGAFLNNLRYAAYYLQKLLSCQLVNGLPYGNVWPSCMSEGPGSYPAG